MRSVSRRRNSTSSGQLQGSDNRQVARMALIGTVSAAVITAISVVIAAMSPHLLSGAQSGASPGASVPGVASSSPPLRQPLTIAVQQSDEYCREGWVLPNAPRPIPQANEVWIDWPSWARQQGAVRVNRHEVLLTVQGVSEARVVIDRIRVVILGPRRAPTQGTLVDIECGEPFEYRYMEANLDKNPPTVTSKTTGSISGERDVRLDPAKFPYQVAIDEAESFIVSSVVSKYDVDWRIELDWSSQGQSGTIEVYDNGQPFRTSSSSNANSTCVWWDSGIFVSDSSVNCTV